jgi:5'(3')-deoxyribonucleotidase
MKKNKCMQILLVDIDGVACSHAEAICNMVNITYGTNAKYEDVKSWNHDFGPVDFPKAVKEFYTDKDFILNMEVTPDFHKFIASMERIMMIKFASSRKNYCHDATTEWVKNKIGNYEIIFTNIKANIPFDYLIDDYHEECIKAANKGKTVFMINRPWNDSVEIRQEIKKHPTIQIMYSFKDIEHSLKSRNNGIL